MKVHIPEVSAASFHHFQKTVEASVELSLTVKNYVGYSEIKFEYYMGTVHSSYLDFVMKDAKGRVHIFEVKSVNESNSQPGCETGLYLTKITEIKKAYQQASKLTSYVF